MANVLTAGNSSNGGTAISTDTSGTLNIVTGSGSGATAIAIDASQNVGVGTTSPTSFSTYKYLQVQGSAAGTGGVFYTNTSDSSVTGQFYSATGQVGLSSNTNTPLVFATNSVERARIDTSGNLLVTNVAGLGYGTGAGGTVTQATSKATAVTLNKPTGQITTNNSALGGSAETAFIVNNSVVAATDTIIVTNQNGNYIATAYGVASGQFAIRLRNLTGGSLSDAVVINFAIIRGVTA